MKLRFIIHFHPSKALECREFPSSSTITVKSGWVIGAIDVDGYKVGNGGGFGYVTKLAPKEKVTAIEYGYMEHENWATGTLCSLTIHTNFDEYGPYSYRYGYSGCFNIKRVEIPSDISFKNFLKKNAEETTDGDITIHRD